MSTQITSKLTNATPSMPRSQHIEQSAFNDTFQDDEQPWRRENGSDSSQTFESHGGNVSDGEDGNNVGASNAEPGWQTDRDDSRTRRDRLKEADLTLNQFDYAEQSMSSPRNSTTRSTKVNEIKLASIANPLSSKNTVPLTLDIDDNGNDIVYETDDKGWSESYECDQTLGHQTELHKKLSEHQSEDARIDHPTAFLRRKSSNSIQYEADVVNKSNYPSSTTGDKSPIEVSAARDIQILPFAFDDTLSTIRNTANEATANNDDSMPDITTIILGEQSQSTLYNFAMEHRLFAKALLALLAQRDQYRPDEMDMDAPIIKAGPLKKASHLVRGVWKVKYVEVRKGMFSYFEDVEHDEGQLARKNIPLTATSVKCRPVKVNHNALIPSSGGAIFELTEESGHRRLWISISKEERQVWMRAIQDAMVGGSLTRGGENNGNDNKYTFKRKLQRSPFRKDLERYLKIQKEIKAASTKGMYLGALSKLLGSSLNVPVQWITEQAAAADENDKAFHEDNASSGVDQLWKDLLRDTVRINGDLFQGGSGHSPEKIIGALTRDIMGFDRSSPLHNSDQERLRHDRSFISELQALSFARDILLSGNRTRSGGDSYFCVDTLCRHNELVVAVPNSLEAEPWNVTITHAIPNKANKNVYSLNDRSGWLRTRSKPHKPWKRRYFVNSDGILSYYEKALPRPHGLRGQITLIDNQVTAVRCHNETTSMGVGTDDTCFLVTILNREGGLERQIMFESENKFLAWAHGFEGAMKMGSTNTVVSPQLKNRFRIRTHIGTRDELSDQGSVAGGITLGDESLVSNAQRLGLDSNKVAQQMAALSIQGGKGHSTVKISVEASTDYNICTTDPQGDVEEDTWATIRATFLQSFSVCGGVNGRIVRGEEIVRIKILECSDVREVLNPSAISPRELAGIVGRKLLRFSNNELGHF